MPPVILLEYLCTIIQTYRNMADDLKQVADLITAKLNAIERYSLLGAKNVLNIDDVALLTGLSKSHLYKLTCTKQIPHYKPNTKAVYFDRVEIEEWMKQNRVTTQAEAEQQALAYVVKKGGAK
jgi:excisionase family DNA binding protein